MNFHDFGCQEELIYVEAWCRSLSKIYNETLFENRERVLATNNIS